MSMLPRLPQVKPEHNPYRIVDDRIRIGGMVHGVGAEIADPSGWIWTLLAVMDGSRTLDEVGQRFGELHPEAPPDWVPAAAAALMAAGHLVDAAAEVPGLTSRDRERHERGRRFYRWIDLTPGVTGWEPLAKLRAARVTVVGLGGTGCNAALALAAGGVGELHCVDGDRVSLSNLNRQLLYTEHDLGKSKIDVGVARLRELNSDTRITGTHHMITGPDDLRDLAEQCDVLVMCADTPTDIAKWANRACLAANRPWVDAGYHGPVVLVATYVPGQGPCRECTRVAQREGYQQRRATPVDPVVRNPTSAVIAPAAGISGHLAALAAMSLITGVPAPMSGQTRGLSLLDPHHSYVRAVPRHPDCPDCGGQP